MTSPKNDTGKVAELAEKLDEKIKVGPPSKSVKPSVKAKEEPKSTTEDMEVTGELEEQSAKAKTTGNKANTKPLKHMTKDRPQGPLGRRKPSRKPKVDKPTITTSTPEQPTTETKKTVNKGETETGNSSSTAKTSLPNQTYLLEQKGKIKNLLQCYQKETLNFQKENSSAEQAALDLYESLISFKEEAFKETNEDKLKQFITKANEAIDDAKII